MMKIEECNSGCSGRRGSELSRCIVSYFLLIVLRRQQMGVETLTNNSTSGITKEIRILERTDQKERFFLKFVWRRVNPMKLTSKQGVLHYIMRASFCFWMFAILLVTGYGIANSNSREI